MMHVCYLCNEYPPARHGGVGVFVQQIARELVCRGVQVTVLGVYSKGETGEDDDQGVRVIRAPRSAKPPASILTAAWNLRTQVQRLCAREKVDLFDGTELSFGWPVWPAGVPRIIRLQGGHHFFSHTLGRSPRKGRAWLERQSFSRASAFCAVSEFVLRATSGLIPLGSKPAAVVPNPVNTSAFRVFPREEVDPLRIFFAGTICRKKGVLELVQAMPRIVASVPAARLVIAGKDRNEPDIGPFVEYLRRHVAPEVRPHIEYLGPVPHSEMPALMGTSGVCVFPSFMESQGIVFVEAMASGRPVIGPDTGPAPEMIEDGKSGLLCDPHRPDSIAAQVIRCLKDAELRERLGQAGRRRAVQDFSVERMADRNLEFYEQVVAGKAA
jgi:glycosyltransferase involved in cell wall biosynthesis